MFPRIAYLHWIEGRPEAATHDLGSTNQRLGDALERLGDRPDAPEVTSLEALLAAELGVDVEQVLVTAGTSHANLLATAAALEGEGDEVLLEAPSYEPLWATAEGLGASVHRFDRHAADGYRLDPDIVTAELTGATSLVAVTDRHNPSGLRADPDALDAFADASADRGAPLLIDEVYAPFDAGTTEGSQFGARTAAGEPNTVVTGGLTKFFGLGDLRIGWLVADAAFVERAREVAAHVPTVSGVTRQLAARLLADPVDEVGTARERAEANATRLERFVTERQELDGAVHGACPFGLFEHGREDGDAVAAAAWSAGVLVVPGRFFGAPDRIRLAASGPPPVTDRALEAFGEVLDAL